MIVYSFFAHWVSFLNGIILKCLASFQGFCAYCSLLQTTSEISLDTRTGLDLLFSCLKLVSAGTVGMCHQAWLCMLFFICTPVLRIKFYPRWWSCPREPLHSPLINFPAAHVGPLRAVRQGSCTGISMFVHCSLPYCPVMFLVVSGRSQMLLHLLCDQRCVEVLDRDGGGVGCTEISQKLNPPGTPALEGSHTSYPYLNAHIHN